MRHKLFVCGNAETIFEGTYLSRDGNKDDAGPIIDAACNVIDDHAKATSEVDQQFRNWHGGRFDQFYTRCGLVAYSKDAPAWVAELAEKASDAMHAELARIEAAAIEADNVYARCQLCNEGCSGPTALIMTTLEHVVEDAISWADAQIGHPYDRLAVVVYSDENEREEVESYEAECVDGEWEAV